MRFSRRAFLAAGLAFVAAPAAAADAGALRIAVAVGPTASPFWTVRDARGAPQGMTVDLGRALAARLNRAAEIVAFANSGEITEAAARGAWDVTFVPVDDARKQRLDFGPAYDTAESTYLVRAGVPAATIADVDQADMRIAAIANTTTGRAAQATLKHAKVTGFATIDEVLALLRADKIDAFALSRGSLDILAATLPGTRVLPGFFTRTTTAIAVPKGRPDLLAKAVGFMQDSEGNGLLQKIRTQNKLP